jgi:hypothetical protein
MDIAKERGMPLIEILSHDLLMTSPLFDGDLPAHVDKSKLVDEIEPGLDLTKWSPHTNLSTHVIVDFMSKMRQISVSHFATLGDVVKTIISSSIGICNKPEFVHLSSVVILKCQ